jgi:hypothetical protein
MKKMALEVLEQGLKHRDNTIRGICRNAMQMLGQKVPKMAAPKKPPVSHLAIREIPKKRGPGRRVITRRTRR